ncbi:MAG: DUF362 domain-containing protein [Candidatus Lokiarchaeota archaeon]|nr:DUF362 domain-containing protein [Candidatus Harpocratesius repetitus]
MTLNTKPSVIIEKVELPDEKHLYPLHFSKSEREALLSTLQDHVVQIFKPFSEIRQTINQRREILIKINGIDGNPYCYTRPLVLEATIRYLQTFGKKKIYVIENSTQGNFTRIVFATVGYDKVCKRTGAIPIYLDELPTSRLPFKRSNSIKEIEYNKKKANKTERIKITEKAEKTENQTKTSDKYDLQTFHLPTFLIEKLIERREEVIYINLPKLKTHSMSGVTLGIKNQWGLPVHQDRSADHNFRLHEKLVDVLEYIQPDFTLIEGIEGTVHGHYPAQALADEMIIPFRILIGGDNIIAVDLVGARVFGLTPEEIPHLKIAINRNLGYGVRDIDDIQLIGDLSPYSTKYETDLIQKFPPDVKWITGKELWCKEGCRNNPLSLLQILYLDYGGKGGFTFVAGKGLDLKEIDKIEGKVFIAGHCALEEVKDRLITRLGKKNVYCSGGCNNLAETTAALLHLMHVDTVKLVPINPIKAIFLYILAKLHGSNSKVPPIWAHLIKSV